MVDSRAVYKETVDSEVNQGKKKTSVAAGKSMAAFNRSDHQP
jgi:hypothetical protein